MRTLGHHKGSNAQLRFAKLQLYMQSAGELFCDARCATLHWDGSVHGGPNVLTGCIVDPVLETGAYFRPEAGA